MRSNMASTCGSASRTAVLMREVLLEARQERDELVELLRVLLLQRLERRHRRSWVDQRARDRLAPQARPDVREGRARSGVAVLADLVTAKTAGRGGHVLALHELRRHFHVDLG